MKLISSCPNHLQKCLMALSQLGKPGAHHVPGRFGDRDLAVSPRLGTARQLRNRENAGKMLGRCAFCIFLIWLFLPISTITRAVYLLAMELLREAPNKFCSEPRKNKH